MLMADTMSIFFIVAGMLLALPACWLLCRGLWPTRVTAAAEVCRRGITKSLLAGLPLTFLAVFLTVVISKFAGLGKIAAAALFCLYLLYSFAGVAGLATVVGERLWSSTDETQPWRTTFRGGSIMALSFLLPVLGWFVLLPAAVIAGNGAVTLSLVLGGWRRIFSAVGIKDGGQVESQPLGHAGLS